MRLPENPKQNKDAKFQKKNQKRSDPPPNPDAELRGGVQGQRSEQQLPGRHAGPGGLWPHHSQLPGRGCLPWIPCPQAHSPLAALHGSRLPPSSVPGLPGLTPCVASCSTFCAGASCYLRASVRAAQLAHASRAHGSSQALRGFSWSQKNPTPELPGQQRGRTRPKRKPTCWASCDGPRSAGLCHQRPTMTGLCRPARPSWAARPPSSPWPP